MLRVLFAILICSTCGCGTFTCLNMATENPRTEVIYGGVRTDVNCIVSTEETHKARSDYYNNWYGPTGRCVLKTCSVIDLPLSLAADTVLLPYAIWITLKKKPVPPVEVPDDGTVEEPWGK